MAETDQDFGLHEDWESVLKTLEAIIPVYDKTNRFISLGTDLKIRNEGLQDLATLIGKDNFSVLDLGCGTGKMSQLLQKNSKDKSVEIVLTDPLRKMLQVARSKVDNDALICVYESLPIRPKSFDAAMAGFSLRDAKRLSIALLEIHALLKDNGKFLIVDLSKPNSRLRRSIIGAYWKLFAPLVAFIAAGRLGLQFGALSTTYKRLPKISDLLDITRAAGFELLVSKYSMLGGACLIVLSKAA